jgi:hypothetical protein
VTPALAAASLAQVALFAVVGWVVGDWLVAIFVQRGSHAKTEEISFEWPERALLSVAGFVVFSLVLMVANIILGGAVFGTPGVVTGAAIVLVAARWRLVSLPRAVPWRRLLLFLVVAMVLWSAPTFLSGTAARSGDTPWHLGWTEQLLAGEPVPEGPAPSEVSANAYPWGFHALLATLVRLVPGSDALTALIALQLILVVAIPLGAACLARRLTPAAGWAAASATAFIGGWGWLAARGPAFATSPSESTHGADLVVASPNAVYELLPPPPPREVALVMLSVIAVFLAIAIRDRRRTVDDANNQTRFVLAGVLLGCTGLVSVPMIVAGVCLTVAAIVLGSSKTKRRDLVAVLGPALLVFALWAGPVIKNLIEHGGFVNVTPVIGMEWPLWTALSSWGLLVPLVVLGVVSLRRRGERSVVGAFGVAIVLLLGLAIIRGAFDWQLAGNATVLHQGRIWPAAHLLAGAVGGVGLWHLWRGLAGHSRRLAQIVTVSILAVGAASPALASASLSKTMIEHDAGFAYRTSDLDEGSFVREVAELLEPDDTLLVDDPSLAAYDLAFHVFSFSGVRLAAYDDPRLASNDLRIRYRGLANTWDRRAGDGGFVPTHVIVPDSPELAGELRGVYRGRLWVLTRAQ